MPSGQLAPTADCRGALEMPAGRARADTQKLPHRALHRPPSAATQLPNAFQTPQGQNRGAYISHLIAGAAAFWNAQRKEHGGAALLHICHRGETQGNYDSIAPPSGWSGRHRARLHRTLSEASAATTRRTRLLRKTRYLFPDAKPASCYGDAQSDKATTRPDMVSTPAAIQHWISVKAAFDGSRGPGLLRAPTLTKPTARSRSSDLRKIRAARSSPASLHADAHRHGPGRCGRRHAERARAVQADAALADRGRRSKDQLKEILKLSPPKTVF